MKTVRLREGVSRSQPHSDIQHHAAVIGQATHDEAGGRRGIEVVLRFVHHVKRPGPLGPDSRMVTHHSTREAEKTQNYESVNRLCKKQCLDMGETKFRREELFNSQGKLIKTQEK